jgi:phosphatidate cytidylyltransferase
MAPHRQILVLFGGSAAALLVASAVGAWLAHRDPGNAAIANFNSRTRSWWVMVAILALAMVTGPGLTVVLYAAVSGFALYEFLRLSAAWDSDRMAIFLAFAVLLPGQYLLIWVGWSGMFSILIPVYGFLFLPILSTLRGDSARFVARTSELHWGLMVAVFCLSHVPALLMVRIPGFEGRNIFLIAFLIIVVEASDVLQYLWGKLVGRTKIAPTLSPSKTVEGLVAGAASACALGTGLWWMTPFAPWQALLVSMGLTMMGFLGGLVMSAIKRDRRVKDWGVLIPGHGGMLDRIDAVLFAAPVYFHVIRFWWGG